MARACKIILTLNNDVFRSPEAITGKVTVILTEPMKCKAVSVSICGEGVVAFDVGRAIKRASERYVYIKDILFGPGVGMCNIILNAGQHTYPFSFNLPANIPNTFLNYPLCHVHYYCEAILDRAFKADIKQEKFFIFMSTLDLNQFPCANEKVETDTCNNTGWHGAIIAKCQLNKGAYVTGERIMVNIEVSNRSRMAIFHSETYLFMKRVYKAEGHTTQLVKEIDHCNNNHHIAPDLTAIWTNILKIPLTVPPSNLGYSSNIITLDYFICVNIEPRRALLRTSLQLPVIIGTIPLHHLSPPSYNDVIMSDSPPPSYEDCILDQSGFDQLETFRDFKVKLEDTNDRMTMNNLITN